MTDFPLFSGRMNRRSFLGSAAAGAAGLAMPAIWTRQAFAQDLDLGSPSSMYSARVDGGHSLPAIPYDKIDKRWLRQIVVDPTNEKPGTIVVDTQTKFLHLVLPGQKALRYGVSLGKSGFEWTGSATINYKKAWPVWTPPPEMIKRKPELAKYAKGMPPGPQSPLGARALYLFKGGRDTMYRLHGTPDWSSIGKNASSGCVRMLNQDVIDLFSRVSGPTTVHVRHSMYLGADSSKIPFFGKKEAEAIDAGVPEGAEVL